MRALIGGWTPDPHDSRDFRFAELAADALGAPVVGEILLAAKSPVRDQGLEPSCVGHAVAAAFEQVASGDGVRLSPMFLWWAARQRCGAEKLRTGTFIRAAMAAAKTMGVCREDLWPADVSATAQPGILALEDGRDHRLDSFYRITADGIGRLDEVDAALAAGFPVAFGTRVGLELAEYRSADAALVPPVAPIGGHAMLIVGRRVKSGRRQYRIRNSWGVAWGDRGFAWFDESYVAWNWTADLWVARAAEGF